MSKIVRSIKNVANGYSSVQVLVRNATSNDPSGPTTYEMEEIASYTNQSHSDFLEIMDMLDRRLNDKGKNWRHVAKSLTVLDYLVRYGSEKCVLWLKDNLYIVKTLREFIHFDEMNNDQGAIIRVKAKELVSLLNNDERLRHERELAAASSGHGDSGSRRRNNRSRTNTVSRRNNDPYDDDLQRALELSRITAEQEKADHQRQPDDPELQAALKLSLEEEEMRKQKQLQNTNLLDLDDNTVQQYQPQQQQYYVTGYYQQQQPQQYAQYDMFGNPIQNTGFYPQQTGFQQPQQYPQFTGFNYQQPQQPQQPQEPLAPLKTGSNNPFALQSEPSAAPAQLQTLNDLANQQLQQLNFFTQPQQQPQPPQQPQQPQQPLQQQLTSSKFNDSTHSELNNLLAQGTGIDTFGNTGASRIPHQHTRTENFINSSGTGYKQQQPEQRLSSNATGNPFLNTGIGYQQQQAANPQPINPAYTGYGFGNAPQQQQRNGNDGPSLIDI